MTSRYDSREIGVNSLEQYQNVLENRGVKRLLQHFTPDFSHLTSQNISELDVISHRWDSSSRYFKLAQRYYNDASKWWVIAWTNGKPTDSHNKIGDTILVYLPLEKVLNMLNI